MVMMMSIFPSKDSLRDAFNWLAAPAARSYTLREAFQHYVQKQPFGEVKHDNRMRYTNGGRMVERLHVAGGVISAAFALAAAPAIGLPLALGAGLAFIGLYKVMGMAAGKLADGALRDIKNMQTLT